MSAGDPQSLNRYSYVSNNPTNSTDPTGMLTTTPDGAVGGFTPGDGGAMGRHMPGVGSDMGRDEKWESPEDVAAAWYGLFAAIGAEAEAIRQSAASTNQGRQNPVPQMSQASCDSQIARIFGGAGAVVATATEPGTLQHPTAGQDRSNHLYRSGVFHIYGNAQGTAEGVRLPRG